jgi:hypothetical protein
MTSPAKNVPVAPSPADERREKVLRDLKLALVDQHAHKETAGCNPYNALQGQVRSDRWGTRKR